MFDYLLRQVLLLLEPVGLLWLGLIILTILLFRGGHRRLGSFASGLVLFLTIIGSTDVPGAILRSLERPWAGVELASLPEADAIVMLGGGIEASRYEVNHMHLTRAGDRILMAMEMVRLKKAPVLVLGGNSTSLDGTLRVEADMLRTWLGQWQPQAPEMISLGRCSNTHDEGLGVKNLAATRGWKRVLLVTSASHMRRSVAVFRTLGIDVIPVPCNFLTSVSTAPPPPGISVPRADGFQKISYWMHEQVGWFWYRKKGWISADAS